MPRDGSGTYSQPFPPVTEGTTIESTVYNGYTADVSIDLNSPRPILAGGTGATSADEALDNLKAEKFKQVVTNWDATVWRAGSFYAATTAIGSAPVASHAFAGVAYYANATDFVCEATDTTDPANPDKYIRVMAAGVWGAWIRLNPNTSAANLSEYTFNNQVTFPPGSGQIRFNNATQNSTTEVFISHLTATGVDNSSQIAAYLTSGVDFIIQDKDEGNKYKVFTTTAAAVLSGGDYRVTATLKISGVDLVSAQRMLVTASSETQRVQQRQLIYAAPFDALAYNGMQVNGSMEVSQQYGSTQGVATGYMIDGWSMGKNGPQTMYFTQIASTLPGFVKALYIQVNPANPTPGAGDYTVITQPIEGYRIARLAWGTASAQPITVAFWVNAVRPGTYSGAIKGTIAGRSYAFSFTINAVSTWEYKTVTIPGDTVGIWPIDNTTGLELRIAMMAGATYTTAANTWVNGNFLGVNGTTNGIAAITDEMRLTGVVVLPGIEAPSAARSPLIMRPYDQELVTCQRYWQRNGTEMGVWTPATATEARVAVGYLMRAAPAISLSNGTGAIERIGVAVLNVTAVSGTAIDPLGSQLILTTAASAVNAACCLYSNRITFDARL